MSKKAPDSPNADIDDAIADLMKELKKEIPWDAKVKIINTAVGWEKVKHSIRDEEEGFDPDNL